MFNIIGDLDVNFCKSTGESGTALPRLTCFGFVVCYKIFHNYEQSVQRWCHLKIEVHLCPICKTLSGG